MPLHPGYRYVLDSNKVYREEGAEDGDRKREGSGSAGRARGNDAGPGRHGQDRSKGGGEARGAWTARAGGLALRPTALRLGELGHMGTRARRSGVCVRLLLPGHSDAGRSGSGALVRRTGGAKRGSAAGAPLGAGRGGGTTCRGGLAGGERRGRRRVDDRALRLVHAELRRVLPAGADPERRGRPPVRGRLGSHLPVRRGPRRAQRLPCGRRPARPRTRAQGLRRLRARGRRNRRLGRQTMSGLLYAATLVTALGCGLVAGVFFAFSTFVMAALRRLPAAEGITAMQWINILAVTPAFMT